MLTLSEVARGMGISITPEGLRKRLRRLERKTGRTILTERGNGNGKRFYVNPKELAAAMGGQPLEPEPDEPEISDIDSIAAQIADAVEAMTARVDAMSLRLAAAYRRIENAESRLRAVELRRTSRT
jgi:hypothetical protein